MTGTDLYVNKPHCAEFFGILPKKFKIP